MFYVYQTVGQSASSKQTPHYGHLEGDGDFVLMTPGLEHLKPQSGSDYLVEVKEEIHEDLEEPHTSSAKLSFAAQCGYVETRHSNFGRNDLSSKLGEYRVSVNDRACERAFSWLGVLVQPLANQLISLDLGKKAADTQTIYVQGSQPYEQFSFPSSLRTTFSSLLFHREIHDTNYWSRYLRIERSGSIEYADTKNVFLEVKGLRIFKFVQIIGLVWLLGSC